jgi:alcohol dehydrogenase class IV
VTSCLLMPHVMRHMASRQPERLAALAEATGSGRGADPLAAADDVEGLIRSLGLPQRIAAFGIGEPELRAAAEAMASAQHSAPELLAIYLAAL